MRALLRRRNQQIPLPKIKSRKDRQVQWMRLDAFAPRYVGYNLNLFPFSPRQVVRCALNAKRDSTILSLWLSTSQLCMIRWGSSRWCLFLLYFFLTCPVLKVHFVFKSYQDHQLQKIMGLTRSLAATMVVVIAYCSWTSVSTTTEFECWERSRQQRGTRNGMCLYPCGDCSMAMYRCLFGRVHSRSELMIYVVRMCVMCRLYLALWNRCTSPCPQFYFQHWLPRLHIKCKISPHLTVCACICSLGYVLSVRLKIWAPTPRARYAWHQSRNLPRHQRHQRHQRQWSVIVSHSDPFCYPDLVLYYDMYFVENFYLDVDIGECAWWLYIRLPIIAIRRSHARFTRYWCGHIIIEITFHFVKVSLCFIRVHCPGIWQNLHRSRVDVSDVYHVE